MDLRTLTADWLETHGYDGLWDDGYPGESCGCFRLDLMPCDRPSQLCQPGYAQVVEGPDGESCDGVGPDKQHDLVDFDGDLKALVAFLAREARGEGAG